MCIIALASFPSASADMGLVPAIIMLAMAILVIVVLVLVLVLIEVLQVCYHSHCREVCPIEPYFLQVLDQYAWQGFARLLLFFGSPVRQVWSRLRIAL